LLIQDGERINLRVDSLSEFGGSESQRSDQDGKRHRGLKKETKGFKGKSKELKGKIMKVGADKTESFANREKKEN
jgi:hypothetical protein